MVTKKYAQTIIRQVVHISHFIFVPYVINRYGNFGNIFKYNYAFSPVLFKHLRNIILVHLLLISTIYSIINSYDCLSLQYRQIHRVKAGIRFRHWCSTEVSLYRNNYVGDDFNWLSERMMKLQRNASSFGIFIKST